MDLPEVYNLEKTSYPPDEAASKAKLQYRQHHAAPFFRCAILSAPDDGTDDDNTLTNIGDAADVRVDTVSSNVSVPTQSEEEINSMTMPDTASLEEKPKMIGYITASRCHTFNKESMSVHSSTGPILAIHSIVVAEPFRRKGYASAMLDNYIKTVRVMDLKHGIQKIVLISKGHLLSFYVKNGFKVIKPSDIVHGVEPWYECELDLGLDRRDADKGCQYWVVDSFAKYPMSNTGNIQSTRGSGNPAAVVLVTPSQLSSPLPSTMNFNSNVSPIDPILESESISPFVTFDPNSEENIEWMKVVAKEFNQSETAFIWEYIPPSTTNTTSSVDGYASLDSQKLSSTFTPTNDGSTLYEIRFYTRNGSRVELCGHATLAASSIIFQTMAAFGKKRDEMQLTLRTQNGTILKAKPSNSTASVIKGVSSGTKVSMEFPWKVLKDWSSEKERLSAIQMIGQVFFPNVDVSTVEQEHIIFVGIEDNGDDLLVELNYRSFISLPRNVEDINTTPMTLWNGYNRGIIVCCRAETPSVDEEASSSTASMSISSGHINIDFFSRFFAPKVGILEDSVTGSAHCLLGPYYGSQLDKRSVTGLQMSERGGIVECNLRKSGDNSNTVKKTVVLSGTAITTMSGTLFL